MRKKTIFALLSLFLGFPLFSQMTISLDSLRAASKPFEPEWAFGVNAGVTLSTVRFNPTIKQENLLKYAGGITARYISEKTFGLQVELNYSLRGWDLEADTTYKDPTELVQPSDTLRFTSSRSLAYFELPILTHIYFNMGDRMRLIFLMGPQVSWYLGEKSVSNRETFHPTPQKVQKPFDYGILGGMGVELRTGIGSFVLDGRYYFGLSDIFNSTKADYFQASSNQVMSVKLTYLFRK